MWTEDKQLRASLRPHYQNPSKISQAGDLTAGEVELGFQYRDERVHAILWGSDRKEAPACGHNPRPIFHTHVWLIRWVVHAKFEACRLTILDKGKPVARPGRKAKDQSCLTARLAAWLPKGC